MSMKVELTPKIIEGLERYADKQTTYEILDLFFVHEDKKYISVQLSEQHFLVLGENGQDVERSEAIPILEQMLAFYTFYQHALEQGAYYEERSTQHFQDFYELLEQFKDQLGSRKDSIQREINQIKQMCTSVIESQKELTSMREQVIEWKQEITDTKGFITTEDVLQMIEKQSHMDAMLYKQGSQIQHSFDDIKTVKDFMSKELEWSEKYLRLSYWGLRGTMNTFTSKKVRRINEESLHTFETNVHGEPLVNEYGTLTAQQLLANKKMNFDHHFQSELLPLLLNK